MRLFNDQSNPTIWKALIAAKFNGISIDVVTGADAEGVLHKHPLEGKSPVLETEHGTIFEANAIARYVARLGKNKLYGSSTHEIGLVEQWIEFSASEIDLPAAVWVYPILGYISNNEDATEKAKGDIRKALDILNRHLLANTYLVGHRITLADIVVSMSLYYLYKKVLDPSFRRPYANTTRWYTTVVNQTEFRGVIGEVQLNVAMEVAVEGAHPTPQQQPTEKGGKKEKQQQPPAQPKKEKAKPAKEETNDEEEEEENYEDKPKGKNPLDLLPPSKFILDEWKRKYSNEDKRSAALPWFWQNFDPEGWSIWICDYKYNDELKKLFMTMNLVSGFVQRLEKLRKYGFGTILVFGQESTKLALGCCFLVRSQEMPKEMTECDDVEHYSWRKADPNDSATRDLINDFWAFDDKFAGKEFHGEGKVFK